MKFLDLSPLLDSLPNSPGALEVEVSGISISSNEVLPGDLFIALAGGARHGGEFIADAKARGAVAVIVDQEFQSQAPDGIPIIRGGSSKLLRSRLGDLAAYIYSHPFDSLYSVALTGTNGKTTTATLLAELWRLGNRRVGQVGTTGIWIDQEFLPAKLTTPEASSLQRYGRQMVGAGVTHFVGEASSHALALGRLHGARFQIGAFTNLSQDHLDFHGAMEQYFLAKSKLFTPEYCELGLINIDDAWGERLAAIAQIPIITLSLNNVKAHWHYTNIEVAPAPLATTYVSIRGSGGILIEGQTKLVGRHNLYNLLMAVALATESGMDPLEIGNVISELTPPPGRMQEVANNSGARAFVDFAHSPDAVERILQLGQEVAGSDGKVIGILGCGGDRDASKRPIMGQLLAAGADIAIMTSDNPRSENPLEILRQMQGELQENENLFVEPDRRAAIAFAVTLAQPGDLILLLGKGHESGQEINGVKLPFDDRAELIAAFEKLGER